MHCSRVSLSFAFTPRGPPFTSVFSSDGYAAHRYRHSFPTRRSSDLVGFDTSLTRAAANMGANPITTFFRVQMPLIFPGVVSGGLFAFITSFDEVVIVMFIGSAGQKTLPWQMFIGLREQISPTILAVATILVGISVALLMTLELLRRRSERLRGLSPG